MDFSIVFQSWKDTFCKIDETWLWPHRFPAKYLDFRACEWWEWVQITDRDKYIVLKVILADSHTLLLLSLAKHHDTNFWTARKLWQADMINLKRGRWEQDPRAPNLRWNFMDALGKWNRQGCRNPKASENRSGTSQINQKVKESQALILPTRLSFSSKKKRCGSKIRFVYTAGYFTYHTGSRVQDALRKIMGLLRKLEDQFYPLIHLLWFWSFMLVLP